MAPKKIPAPVSKSDAVIKVDSSEIDTQPPKIIKKKQITKDTSKAPEKEPIKEDKTIKSVDKVILEKQEHKAQEDKAPEDKAPEDNEILLDASKISKSGKQGTTKKTENTTTSNDLFNNEDVDFRTVLLNYDFTKNRTPAKITKYEKALLIGKRAKQIEEGANPNVKVLTGQTAIEIAEEELRQRKIPLIIKRPLGNTFEYWRPRDMEVLMD